MAARSPSRLFPVLVWVPILLVCCSNGVADAPRCCRGPVIQFDGAGNPSLAGGTGCACSSTQTLDGGAFTGVTTIVVLADGTPASLFDSGVLDTACSQLKLTTGCSVIDGTEQMGNGQTLISETIEICGGSAASSCP